MFERASAISVADSSVPCAIAASVSCCCNWRAALPFGIVRQTVGQELTTESANVLDREQRLFVERRAFEPDVLHDRGHVAARLDAAFTQHAQFFLETIALALQHFVACGEVGFLRVRVAQRDTQIAYGQCGQLVKLRVILEQVLEDFGIGLRQFQHLGLVQGQYAIAISV